MVRFLLVGLDVAGLTVGAGAGEPVALAAGDVEGLAVGDAKGLAVGKPGLALGFPVGAALLSCTHELPFLEIPPVQISHRCRVR